MEDLHRKRGEFNVDIEGAHMCLVKSTCGELWRIPCEHHVGVYVAYGVFISTIFMSFTLYIYLFFVLIDLGYRSPFNFLFWGILVSVLLY